MKEVDFDDLKYMSYTLKQSAFSESVVRPDYSLGTVILYGCILCVLVLIIICLMSFYFRVWRNHLNTPKTSDSDNFALKEGGVMQPCSTNNPPIFDDSC